MAGFPEVNSCSGESRPGALCGSHCTLFWTEYSFGLKSASSVLCLSVFWIFAFSSVAMSSPRSFLLAAEAFAVALDAAADAVIDALGDRVDRAFDLRGAHRIVLLVVALRVRALAASVRSVSTARAATTHALKRRGRRRNGGDDAHLDRVCLGSRRRAAGGESGRALTVHRDVRRCGGSGAGSRDAH